VNGRAGEGTGDEQGGGAMEGGGSNSPVFYPTRRMLCYTWAGLHSGLQIGFTRRAGTLIGRVLWGQVSEPG